jgi:hypothetical protein
MELLIDGKPRKIIYNKIEKTYHFKSKSEKVDITSYFKKTDGSLKEKYKKLLVNNNLELKKDIQLLIDGKPRKIIYNKTANIYYYMCKGNKINVSSYFKITDGSLKEKYKKILVGDKKELKKPKKDIQLLIDGKSRKIIYNKTGNIYYYTSKANGRSNKIDVTSYFKVTDGSLKKKYKKMLVGGGGNEEIQQIIKKLRYKLIAEPENEFVIISIDEYNSFIEDLKIFDKDINTALDDNIKTSFVKSSEELNTFHSLLMQIYTDFYLKVRNNLEKKYSSNTITFVNIYLNNMNIKNGMPIIALLNSFLFGDSKDVIISVTELKKLFKTALYNCKDAFDKFYIKSDIFEKVYVEIKNLEQYINDDEFIVILRVFNKFNEFKKSKYNQIIVFLEILLNENSSLVEHFKDKKDIIEEYKNSIDSNNESINTEIKVEELYELGKEIRNQLFISIEKIAKAEKIEDES